MAEAVVAVARAVARAGRRQSLPMLGRWGSYTVWAPAVLVGIAVLLPPVYLAMRALEADATARDLIFRGATLGVAWRSIALAASVTACSTVIAVPLAWLTTRSDVPGRRVWAVLTVLPLVVPSYVGAYLFAGAFGPRGMLQAALEPAFGITRLPSIYGFPGSLLVLTLYTYPYTLLMAQAALLRMDPSVEEAARTLGESAWGVFKRVTLHQLRPAMAAGGLLVALYTLRDFGAVSIMRFNTFTRVIYIEYQSAYDRASAAVLSLGLIAVALLLVVTEMRAEGNLPAYRSGPRSVRRPRLVGLGSWRWPAAAYCAAVVGAALVLPGLVLAFWLVRGFAGADIDVGDLVHQATGSVTASSVGAIATVVAAIPVAWLSVRRRNGLSVALERVTYLGFALPGVVVALSLVFFAAPHPWLYHSLPLLVFAYVILFLPQAVGAVRSSLLQVHPSLEESGRSLGRAPAEVLRSITLPLIAPGVASAGALVFLTAMKELPATLILSPFEFETLAMGVWSAVSEAFFARAAAPALLLILLSSVPMTMLVVRREVAA